MTTRSCVVSVSNATTVADEAACEECGAGLHGDGCQAPDGPSDSEVLVFAYGTLKRGFCNHYNMHHDGIRFWQHCRTVDPFIMFLDSTQRNRPSLTDGYAHFDNESSSSSSSAADHQYYSPSVAPVERCSSQPLTSASDKQDRSDVHEGEEDNGDARLPPSHDAEAGEHNGRPHAKAKRTDLQWRDLGSQKPTGSGDGEIVGNDSEESTADGCEMLGGGESTSPSDEASSPPSSSPSSSPPMRLAGGGGESNTLRSSRLAEEIGGQICGEIYVVSMVMLRYLDRFERVPENYMRYTVSVVGFADGKVHPCEVYFMKVSVDRLNELRRGQFTLSKDYTAKQHLDTYVPRPSNKLGHFHMSRQRISSMIREDNENGCASSTGSIDRNSDLRDDCDEEAREVNVDDTREKRWAGADFDLVILEEEGQNGDCQESCNEYCNSDALTIPARHVL